MKTTTMVITIEYQGIRKQINVLVDEDNIRDVLSVDGVKYLMDNSKQIEQDFVASMLLSCASQIFDEAVNNAKNSSD